MDLSDSKLLTAAFLVGGTLTAGTAFGAVLPITDAEFNLDPTSAAADTDDDGRADQPLSFTSITVNGADYTDFTYGVATVAGLSNTDYYFPPGEDPGSEHNALGGAIVNDGILNVRQNTEVQFARAITANDLVFITDLEQAGDNDRDEPAGIGLLDINGDPIAGTALLVDVGEGGSNLLDFQATFADAGSTGNYELFGTALTLSDFNDYSGSDAYGIYFSSTRSTDPSIVGLAAIPEPTSLAVLGLGGLALLGRRRRN